MASFPAGERYVTAPVNKTVEVPLAPVVLTHSGADKGLVPATHPCSYDRTVDPAMAGKWTSQDQSIVTNPYKPSSRKV